MTQPMSAEPAIEPRLLRGWISRYDLAQELGLTVDTLGRWERRRKGPACVRAGRKIFYRMRAQPIQPIPPSLQQTHLPVRRVRRQPRHAASGKPTHRVS